MQGKNLDLKFYREYLAVQKILNWDHRVSVAVNGRIQLRLLQSKPLSTNPPTD